MLKNDCLNKISRTIGYLGSMKNLKEKEKELMDYIKNNSNNIEYDKKNIDDFKVPYNVNDYHKALVVMDYYGCKVLKGNNIEDIDELCAALDSLIEDDVTKKVFQKLKNIIK